MPSFNLVRRSANRSARQPPMPTTSPTGAGDASDNADEPSHATSPTGKVRRTSSHHAAGGGLVGSIYSFWYNTLTGKSPSASGGNRSATAKPRSARDAGGGGSGPGPISAGGKRRTVSFEEPLVPVATPAREDTDETGVHFYDHSEHAPSADSISSTIGSLSNNAVPHRSPHFNPAAAQQARLATPAVDAADVETAEGCWSPSCYNVFKLLVSIRLTGALWSNISDCDEVYNYWEPLHLMLYGSGFQTWEYSPAYALRSWAYIAVHSFPARLYHWVIPSASKVTNFFFLRCCLSICSAVAEVVLYGALRDRLSRNVARYFFVFTLLSPGMFHAAPAFLPSSFSMTCNMFAMALWLRRQYFGAVFLTAISALVGWPFAAILGLPIVLDLVVQKRRILIFLSHSAFAGVAICLCLLQIDSHYYGRSALAPLNIILYNIFTSHGPDLYGTEPMTFYVVNGLLNLNLSFILGLAALPVTLICFWTLYAPNVPSTSSSHFGGGRGSRPGGGGGYHRPNQSLLLADTWAGYRSIFQILTGVYPWLAVFFSQPHKEERFLFPVYPMFAVASGLTVDAMERLWSGWLVPRLSLARRRKKPVGGLGLLMNRALPPVSILQSAANVAYVTTLTVVVLLFLSRNVALYRNYHAPFDIYMTLDEAFVNETKEQQHQHAASAGTKTGWCHRPDEGPQRICVGKEWYRFPGSFFLSQNGRIAGTSSAATAIRDSANDRDTNTGNNNKKYINKCSSKHKLPDFELAFIRSKFNGLQPKHFNRPANLAPGQIGLMRWSDIADATRHLPTTMNHLNQYQPLHSVPLDTCDWLVDFTTSNPVNPATTDGPIPDDKKAKNFPDDDQNVKQYANEEPLKLFEELEPDFSSQTAQWSLVKAQPFIDSGSCSIALLRAFYVPYLSDQYCRFGNYVLLKRVKSRHHSDINHEEQDGVEAAEHPEYSRDQYENLDSYI